MPTTLLIAQLTDLHVGLDGDAPDERNTVRCRHAVAHVLTLRPRPDLVVVTGDLTEHGDVASYHRVRALLAALPMPVKLMPGNHDARAAMRAVFPELPEAGGYFQQVVELGDRRMILLDTLEEGRAGGGFDAAQADWLRDRLAERPDAPTLLALHHPPFPVGIDWMDPDPAAPWIVRLAEVVRAAPQVVALIGGHLHRPIATYFAGRPFIVASSVAPQIALDLRETRDEPDGRALIIADPPALVLHRWCGDTFLSHFEQVHGAPPIARLDERSAPTIAALRAEDAGT